MPFPEHVVHRWICDDRVNDIVDDIEWDLMIDTWGKGCEEYHDSGCPTCAAWEWYEAKGYAPSKDDINNDA